MLIGGHGKVVSMVCFASLSLMNNASEVLADASVVITIQIVKICFVLLNFVYFSRSSFH